MLVTALIFSSHENPSVSQRPDFHGSSRDLMHIVHVLWLPLSTVVASFRPLAIVPKLWTGIPPLCSIWWVSGVIGATGSSGTRCSASNVRRARDLKQCSC